MSIYPPPDTFPHRHYSPITPTDLAFQSEQTYIRVIPNTYLPQMKTLSSGTFGPLTPPRPANVPLWIAVALSNANKVEIVLPEWLEPEKLREKWELEKEQNEFVEMPFHYQHLAVIILENMKVEEASKIKEIRGLLADIRQERQRKARLGLSVFLSEQVVKVTNISLHEIYEIKPFYLGSMDEMRKMMEG